MLRPCFVEIDDISVASNLDLMDGSVVGDSDTHTEEHTVVPVFTPAPSKFRGKGSVSEAGKTPKSTFSFVELYDSGLVSDFELTTTLVLQVMFVITNR